MAKIESQELKNFIRSTIENIEKGLKKGYELIGDIEFEVAVVNLKKVGGGLRLLVVDASGKYSKEAVTKIKFRVGQSFPPVEPMEL